MPTYVVRPTVGGSPRSNSPVVNTGGSLPAIVADSSDATYTMLTSTTLPLDEFYGSFPSIGANERVVSCALSVRAKNAGALAASVTVGDRQSAGLFEGPALAIPGGQAAITTLAQLAQQGALVPPGAPTYDWNAATWPMFSIRDPNASALWYDLWWTLYTYKAATIGAPTITPTTGGVDSTVLYPTLAATVSAIVESWQVWAGGGELYTTGRVEFSIYNAADAPGASPPVGVQPLLLQVVAFDLNTYIDGVTPSTLPVSYKLTSPLPDGAYALFARVVRDHPTGNDSGKGASAWSAYQKATWTQSVGTPAAPTYRVETDDAGQGIKVHAYLTAPAAYTQSSGLAYLERAYGSGWRQVRGCYGVAVPTANDYQLPEDYECARNYWGGANTYRLRSSYVNATDGTLAYSPWVEFAATGPACIGTGWNIKTVEAPAFNWLSAGILAEPAEADQTQAATFYPLDRDLPVVVKGSTGGWSRVYDFLANGLDQCPSVRGLQLYGQGLLLVETAFADTFYATITGLTIKRQGTPSAPRYVGTITLTEVDCDLGWDAV
jgi:hypothetical protein